GNFRGMRMASVDRGLIEYREIDVCSDREFKTFRQINYENIFSVACQKPDIEQIIKVDGKVNILNYEFIKTPVGTSVEGQKLTGYKLLVNGDIVYKIQYFSKNEQQSVHTFHHTAPFCGSVVLPNCFNTSSYVCPSVLIEDISINQIDERCVYSNILVLLIADIN
ncbi:MAG: DUF3794 domain-containing protein, partial [Brevinemataceae bacterium]